MNQHYAFFPKVNYFLCSGCAGFVDREDHYDVILSSAPAERQMRKRFGLLVLTASTGLTATAGLSVLWSSVVLAAKECIEAPNLRSSQRNHWYYHTDPASHRKCWYLGPPGVEPPQVASSESRSSPEPKRKSGM